MAWTDGWTYTIGFSTNKGAGISYQTYSDGTVDVWVYAIRENNRYTSSGTATTTVTVTGPNGGSQSKTESAIPYSVSNNTASPTPGKNLVFAKKFDNQGTPINIKVDCNWTMGTGYMTITNIKNYTNAGGSTVDSIKDNDNNTFTVDTIMGSNGTNNAVSNVHIYWRWNNSDVRTTPGYYDGMRAAGSISGSTVKFSDIDFNQTGTVYVRAYSISAQGDNPGGDVSSEKLTNYTGPGAPSNLQIGYNKNKPTPKATYTFSWIAGTAGTNNPITGYNYEIYVNDEKKIDGTTDTTYITPTSLNNYLSKGKTLYFKVQSIGTVSAESLKYSNWVSTENNPTTIVSAGIVHIRLGNEWKEGQVYVRDSNNTWQEASSVYVRDDNSDWRESL